MHRLVIPFILFIALAACGSREEKPATVTKTDSLLPQHDSLDHIVRNRNVNAYAPVDLSPMDMSYYPDEYPKLKMSKQITSPPLARVVYSRPHLQGRKIFHEVLKYGEPWRLGANEATELDLYKDVTIQGKKISAGRYIIYCIPQKDKWTIALNSNIDSWGLEPDPARDIARFSIPIIQTANSLEYFTMVFRQVNNQSGLLIAWDNVEAFLPISF
jgi:hypothetical protein